MLVPVPWKLWLSVYRYDIESTQVSHVGTGTLEVVTFCYRNDIESTQVSHVGTGTLEVVTFCL